MISLPIPPSANNLFPGSSRRFKSAAYKAWIHTAGWELKAQKPATVSGPYTLELSLPKAMRGDISNRIKAVEDLLVQHRITPDDHHCVSITARRCESVEKGRCIIQIGKP